MDENLYRQVIHAVSLTYDPATPSQQRQEAHQFIDQFKSNESCSDYAFYILQNAKEHNDMLRHFALHVLEHLIQTRWNSLQIQQQAAIREAVVGLLRSPAKPMLEEAAYVKEKLAGLVGDLAEREFPQRWTTFVPELMQVWSMGDLQAELCMIVLHNISEDCRCSDFNAKLPAKRRNEVLKGLNALMPELLPAVYGHAAAQFARYKAAPPGSQEFEAAVALLRRGLALLVPFLPWAQGELVAAAAHDFPAVFLGLLAERPVRREALACLQEMAAHKLEEGLFHRLVRELPAAAAVLAQDQSDPAACLPLHRALCATAAGALSMNLNKLPKDAAAAAYIQFLASIAEHPSLTVSHPALLTWCNLVRDESLAKFEPLKAVLPQVLYAYCSKLPKARLDEDGFFEDELFSEDFADAAEYNEFNGKYRGLVVQTVRAVAERFPGAGLEFLLRLLRERLGQWGQPAPGDHLDEQGEVTRASECYRQLEPLSFVAEAVVGSLRPETFALAEVGGAAAAALGAALAWAPGPRHALLHQLRLLLLEAHRHALTHLPDQLMPVLQACFDVLAWRPAWARPPPEDPPGECVGAHRLAAQALVGVAAHCKEGLLPWLPKLCEWVQALQAEHARPDTLVMQLYEMLVLVSNACADPRQRADFLHQILGGALAALESPAFAAAFAGPEALLAQFGVPLDADPRDEAVVAEKTAWYSSVFVALNTLLSVGRRTGRHASKKLPPTQDATLAQLGADNPFVALWPRALPPVLALVRAVHGLWAPSSRDGLLADPRGRGAEVLAVATEELRLKTSVAGVITMDEAGVMAKRERRRHLLYLWPVWAQELRNTAYQVLGLACTQRYLYLTDNAVALLGQSVLWGLEHMENRHLTLLIRQFLCPYVLSMPVSLYQSHLVPVLSPFAVQAFHKFSLAWKPPAGPLSPAQRAYVEGGLFVGQGIDEENRETLVDKLRREATRSYVDLVQEMFALKGELALAYINLQKEGKQIGGVGREPGSGTNNEDDVQFRVGQVVLTPATQRLRRAHAEALAAALLRANPQLTEALLSFCVGALAWPDSYCCRRTLRTAQRITDLTWRDPAFTEFLGARLFATGVAALVQEPKWLVGMEWDILAVVQMVYLRLVFGGTGLDKMAGESRPPSDLPRQFLLSLPGLSPESIASMEKTLQESNSHKDHKDAIRDTLRLVIEQNATSGAAAAAAAGGGEERAGAAESVFRQAKISVLDLPEQLVVNSASLLLKQQSSERNEALGDVIDLFDL